MLTYCTNIHPGESWADVRANLEAHCVAVKAAVLPDAAFPIGLRLSNQAACDVTPDESRRFRDWCEANDCFVLTVNGFPYGQFHGTAVKEKVYEPDWRDPARVAYTTRIADLLAMWLPAGVRGSISTVPIAFRPGFAATDWTSVRAHLVQVLEHLDAIRQRNGVEIILAIEPEPRCVLETTAEAVAFFERMHFPQGIADLAGLCFDCCHQAVAFEDPATSLAALRAAGVVIGKVQVSVSLRAVGEEIANLARFDEPTYLHQVVARDHDGSLARWIDLPDFFAESAARRSSIAECRVHFHVPIFADHLGHCGTTRFFLEDILPQLDPTIPLEVETYSWDALPAELRTESVAESVARELRWVQETLDASHRRS